MADQQADRAESYSCSNCLNPNAYGKDLLSTAFLAKSRQAYMFGHAINVTLGEKVDRKLMTGNYTVSDIYCAKCGQVLGWKYFRAHERRQVYKEGNYILELAKLVQGT